MKDIETVLSGGIVTKSAINNAGRIRLAHEREVYKRLAGSRHIAEVISLFGEGLQLREVEGENAKQWLDFKEDWTCTPQDQTSAIVKLGQYAAAEMDFLERGVMYRDLNLEHLIFTDDTAVMIDLEEAVLQRGGEWSFGSQRGTWETMALEEFKGQGRLTERTATYRVAVVAHLALTGKLPFPRKATPLRSSTHTWRRGHPATVAPVLPRDLRKVFSAALAREPAKRHKDPESFLRALQQTI